MRVSRPSSRLSFDDLIELRFLPSRRRRRDLEYLEQLKSMIMRREVNYARLLEVPRTGRTGDRLSQPGQRSASTQLSSYNHAADHAQAEERTDERCGPSEASAAVGSGRRGAYSRHDSRAGGLD